MRLWIAASLDIVLLLFALQARAESSESAPSAPGSGSPEGAAAPADAEAGKKPRGESATWNPGSEGGGEAGDRDVPAPPVPGLEAVPRGQSPGKWETWAAGQGVERLRRWGISAFFGMGGLPFGNPAGSGADAPDYGDITGPGFTAGFSVEYRVMPAVSLVGQFHFMQISGNEYMLFTPDPGGGGTFYRRLETYGNSLISFGIGLKFVVPFSHLGGMFRLRHAEANTGFLLALKFLAGFAHIDKWYARWEEPSEGISYEFNYFESKQNVYLGFGMGFEYRWTTMGLFLEGALHDMGAPGPSREPGWEESSVAGECVPVTLQAGVSISF